MENTVKPIKQFVMSLIFDYQMTKIALILKNRSPDSLESMIGKWNGIGGNVEKDDLDHSSAALREFEEETGVLLYPDQIFQFGEIHRPGKYCSLWTGLVNENTELRQMTEEPVEWHYLSKLPDNLDNDMPIFIRDALNALNAQNQGIRVQIKQYHFNRLQKFLCKSDRSVS